MTTTVTLPLAGLPDRCPHCGEEPPYGQWRLFAQGWELNVACPKCFTAVAPVRAVAAPRDYGPPPGVNEQTGIAWNE